MQELACLHGEDDRDIDWHRSHHRDVEALEEAFHAHGPVDVSSMPQNSMVALREQCALDARLDRV